MPGARTILAFDFGTRRLGIAIGNTVTGSARPLEEATRIAYRELIRWMAADYGFDQLDAYMMLSQCGRVRLGNFVDPKYTVGAAVSKKYLT